MQTKIAVALIPSIIATLFLAVTYQHGINEESASHAIRVTARISACVFLIVFATSPNKYFGFFATPIINRYRRQWGIAFALAHLVHLTAIILKVIYVYGGEWQQLGTIADLWPGGLIYVFIILMLITSNNFSVKLLGAKGWKALHKVGLYGIMVSFLQSFLFNFINAVSNGDINNFAVTAFHGMLSAAILYYWFSRIFIWFKKKKPAQ